MTLGLKINPQSSSSERVSLSRNLRHVGVGSAAQTAPVFLGRNGARIELRIQPTGGRHVALCL